MASNLIQIPNHNHAKGTVTAVSRRVCPQTGKRICGCNACPADELGKIVDVQLANNTIFDDWFTTLARDIARGETASRPRIMAFSKSVVAESPQPTELDDEFRGATNIFSSSGVLQILCTLGSTEFNSPAGNIRSMGFYYGTDATTTLATGTLGSLINDLNVSKDSSTEVTFQYDISFSSAS